jgi:hypothetical protein
MEMTKRQLPIQVMRDQEFIPRPSSSSSHCAFILFIFLVKGIRFLRACCLLAYLFAGLQPVGFMLVHLPDETERRVELAAAYGA